MPTSILNSVKKTLGVPEDYEAFDPDIILHINSVLSVLEQLGVGPAGGTFIDGPDQTWEEYIAIPSKFNLIRSYVSLRVRLLFDPPVSSFHVDAIKEQIREFEWRLNVQREDTEWVDPNLALLNLLD
jgi:hypothetical protein